MCDLHTRGWNSLKASSSAGCLWMDWQVNKWSYKCNSWRSGTHISKLKSSLLATMLNKSMPIVLANRRVTTDKVANYMQVVVLPMKSSVEDLNFHKVCWCWSQNLKKVLIFYGHRSKGSVTHLLVKWFVF